MNIVLDIARISLKRLNERLRILLRKIGVDRAILWGILARLWSIIAGPILLLFITFKFSPQLQGYYYTFYSIIAFQFLLELGLSNLIIQFASHEWSRLSLAESGEIIGEREALSRLQSLVQIFFRWYCFASIILTLGLGIGGYLFFLRNQSANINWILPWFSLCICNGAIFCLIPIWSLLEGCNQVRKLYAYRFIQGVFSSVSLWIAILLGAQLWAPAISSVVILICAGLFLKYKCRIFFKTLLFSNPGGSRIEWRQEILPLQWRLTIESLIGPFAYTLFVPVLFKYHGSVIAGQMGMTSCLTNILFAIASSWLNPKVPQFGILIAKKKYKELDKLFWHTTKFVIGVALIVAVIAWCIVYVLNEIKHPLAARFLSLLPIGIFLLSQVIQVISLPFSTYLRAHKKDPFLFVAVAGGISIGFLTVIFGKYYSAIGIAICYLLAHLVLVPIVIIIWYRCRIEWHKDEYADPVILDNDITMQEVLS